MVTPTTPTNTREVTAAGLAANLERALAGADAAAAAHFALPESARSATGTTAPWEAMLTQLWIAAGSAQGLLAKLREEGIEI